MINPINNFRTSIMSIRPKTVKQAGYVYFHENLLENAMKKLEPCYDSFKYLSEKYNLKIDLCSFNNKYIPDKPGHSLIIVNDKIVQSINQDMKSTDILRKFYELVDTIINK